MISPNHITTCARQLPQTNFSREGVSSCPERDFSHAFAAAYDLRFAQCHPRSRKIERRLAFEVPVSGLGIPDLVAISWEVLPSEQQSLIRLATPELKDTTVRAFEAKIDDWKRGLMQAYRYRFFADATILVMPAKKQHCVAAHLALFEQLNVGFWTFDEHTNTVRRHFTPRPSSPANLKRRGNAIRSVLESFIQVPLAP